MTSENPVEKRTSSSVQRAAQTRFWKSVSETAEDIFAIFRQSPEWLVIIFAWVAAGFIPAFWYIGEGKMWSQSDSPIFFEPFVPLFCAALLYQDRARLLDVWRATPRSKRRGSPWIIWVGFVLILASHLMHVLTVATLGLLLVVVGTVYMGYGLLVLNATRRALLFGLLFITPPETVVARPSDIIGAQSWKLIAMVLERFGKACAASSGAGMTTFEIEGQIYQILNTQFTVILLSVVTLLFLSVWRRDKIGPTLVRMAAGGLLGGILVVGVPILIFLLPSTPLTRIVITAHPIFLVILAVSVTVFLSNRVNALSSTLSEGSQVIGELSESAQKATDRAAAGVAATMESTVGQAGVSFTKSTEIFIDKTIAFITKPFKRKGRDRW